ncbi:hypothetical protein J6590_014009 [Homalodisca vitripennis]|nr:hypothetical protein J6590_014009 [Homalodisca vitripennis]
MGGDFNVNIAKRDTNTVRLENNFKALTMYFMNYNPTRGLSCLITDLATELIDSEVIDYEVILRARNNRPTRPKWFTPELKVMQERLMSYRDFAKSTGSLEAKQVYSAARKRPQHVQAAPFNPIDMARRANAPVEDLMWTTVDQILHTVGRMKDSKSSARTLKTTKFKSKLTAFFLANPFYKQSEFLALSQSDFNPYF